MIPATTRKPYTVAALAVAALLFVAVNVLAGWTLRGIKIDFTSDRINTLSKGTLGTLASLAEPVTLRLFFSDKLSDNIPPFKVYGGRVREMILEYAARSGGKVKVEIVDPVPFSEAEDGAVQAGIQGVPIDNASGRQFYFGLQGKGPDGKQETIPFFAQERERFLEYDLTRLIGALVRKQKPLIAVMGDVPLEFGPGGIMAAMRGGQVRPYMLLQVLRQTFEVKVLGSDAAEIPDEAAVVVVARPKTMTPQALYAVDQFVLRRGRALVFVDPAAESAQGQGGPGDPADQKAEMPELLAAWGLEMESGRFVGDRALGLSVEAEGPAGGTQVMPHPAWLGLRDEAINREDVVTADIADLNVGSAGSLKKREGATTSITPLLLSSNQASLVDVAKLGGARPDPAAVLRAVSPTGQRYAMAVRVAGPVKSAFPGGAPPAAAAKAEDKKKDDQKPEEQKPTRPHLGESSGPVNLIVVADTDMLEDRFWVRIRDFAGQQVAMPFAANGDFVVNAAENLAGSDDLIRLRSRGVSYRPFTVVEDLRRAAAVRLLARRDELQQALEEIEKSLNALQEKKKQAGDKAVLSDAEEAAIAKFRDEMVRVRRELREVQHGLDRDIERLGAWVKAVNIGLVPLGVLVAALLMGLARRHRRRVRVRRD
ncbi:MAG: ABC transporter [Alphaproteobacteria bacterium]|nr:ABC transporter [Alphaproteobacteria bacterium]